MTEEPRRPTVRLSDVARVAGCSAATVSRVLNAPETVNREARLRVEAAVRDLGYARNGAARALRSRRSRMIGVVLPTLGQPVYVNFIGALQDSLAEEDYVLLVTTCNYSPDRELFQARLLIERGVEGLVLIGNRHRPDLMGLLKGQGLPFLTTFTFRRELDHPMVGFNNFAVMRAAVDHLVGLGHRAFAVLAGPSEANDRIEQRVAGTAAALEAHGLALPPERIVEEQMSYEGGRRGLSTLLGGARPPTAVLCTCDIMAYGVLIECRARALDVPGDLSVIGFDDLQSSAFIFPALTTIQNPADEMARRAAAYLMARLDGRSCPAQVEIEPRLVLRATTGHPRAVRAQISSGGAAATRFARRRGREVS